MLPSYCLHGLVEGAFALFGDRTAVRQRDRAVTYADLDRLANRVARFLLEAKSRSATLSLVGVTSAVTIESIACVLGILRAGLAYVPLDVLSPPARLEGILADAKMELAFLDPVAYPEVEAIAARLETAVHLEERNPTWRRILELDPEIQPVSNVADDLAYVLYTSGSTGVPKGVMLTHRNAITFVCWMAKEFRISPQDRIAGRSPLNFDFSVFDIFNTLYAGATLDLQDARRELVKDWSSEQRHRDYVRMMKHAGSTVLYATPSALMVLLDKGGLDPGVPLRVIMYAGEPFHPAMLSRLMRAMPNTRIANIYGPTETNIVTCWWVEEPPEAPVPIGREVDDTEIIVVGEDRRLCAVGEEGELWVRGGTVCVGYLGKPELTAQRSIESPFHRHPVRYWRTGDIGRRREDGALDYLGRADDMVKTRGYRVEIGDVEAALSATKDVVQGVVLHRPHEKYGATLHAFVRLVPESTRSPEALLEDLGAKLPAYMLPADIRILDEFPYTSTGKVDRQTLGKVWLSE